VTAIGFAIFPVGLIILLVDLLSTSFNRGVLAVGILLMVLGAIYFLGGASMIYMIGKRIHQMVADTTKNLSRKP
jgi:uncharacterized membrane-anchored protein